jgi:hypothetical protein
MRGKLVVLIVLMIGVAVGVAGLRYAYDPSPVWERFDQRRNPLTADTQGPALLVEQTNDFRRVAFTPLEADALGVKRADATYSELGIRPVRLTIEQIDATDEMTELRAIHRAFERDDNVSRLALYEQALTPYLYAVYARQGRAVYEFVWVNDGWLFRAFTDESDAETLLRFVNSYPN